MCGVIPAVAFALNNYAGVLYLRKGVCMRKKLIVMTVAAAITCAAMLTSRAHVQAASLTQGDLAALELFEDIDMDCAGDRELADSIRDGNCDFAAQWLAGKMSEIAGKYTHDLSTEIFNKAMEVRLSELKSADKIFVGGNGKLSELSKSYIVNAAIDRLSDIVDLSVPVESGSYEMTASSFTELDQIVEDLRGLSEREGGPFTGSTEEQVRALNTLALTLQYSVKDSGGKGDTYADKFYAINEIRTYLDTLYHDIDGYSKISDDLGDAVNAIVDSTSDFVDSDCTEVATQLNDVQELVSDYIIQEIQEENMTDTAVPDVAADTDGNNGKSKGKADANTDVPDTGDIITLTEKDINFLTAMFDEHMSAYVDSQVQSIYSALVAQVYNEDTDSNRYAVNIAVEDLNNLQESVDGTKSDVAALKNKFNTLELRTRNDVLILIDEMEATSDAISEIRDTSLTWQNRLKTDMGVLTSQNVVTTFGNLTINASTTEGSATINTNHPADSYTGKWVQDGSSFYVDNKNDAIIEGCDIDIKYLDDPNISPSIIMI